MFRGSVTGRQRTARLGTWGAASAVVLVLWAFGAFHGAELDVQNAHFSVRGRQRPDPRIVLVLIDPATLQKVGQFPFLRRYHARVIERLHADGAAVVGYDVVFAEPSSSPSDDEDLLDAIADAGNVVLADTETSPTGEPNVLGGSAALAGVHATAGSTNFVLDAGGGQRRVSYEIDGLQTFAVAVARRLGVSVRASEFPPGGAPIDYAGPAGTYPALSFVNVMNGRVPARELRGRIVVVGAGDPDLQDVHATPTSPQMEGPEIEANAIATVLRGLPLHYSGDWVTVLLILALAAVAPLAALALGTSLTAATAAGAAALYTGATQIAFDDGRLIALVAPLTAWALSLGATFAVDYATGARERRELEADLVAARQRALDATESERRRLERNLHDGAQQNLIALALELVAVRERRAEDLDPEIDALLQASGERLRETLADLRAIAQGSVPDALLQGGVDGALASLMARMPSWVTLEGTVGRRLGAGVEAVAYFAVSEALSNALKHSRARHVRIAIQEGDKGVALMVCDDGVGGADVSGSGLRGLRERVEAFGGQVAVESPPGKGTRVRIELSAASAGTRLSRRP
jgi:signal transduction histidine kinase